MLFGAMLQNSKGFRKEGGETERETGFQRPKIARNPEK